MGFISLGTIHTFLSAPSLWEGFSLVREQFSPFNLPNVFLTILLLLPAIGARLLGEKFQKDQRL
ncbi:hypothetical protein LCGC14_0903450 [marine sediment metagenome]|uniref:Uncharacterized protein n=1 Tax=marine sediment metagenome TaxID=412755 RepID=A0A0F9RES9_9ZZZZ